MFPFGKKGTSAIEFCEGKEKEQKRMRAVKSPIKFLQRAICLLATILCVQDLLLVCGVKREKWRWVETNEKFAKKVSSIGYMIVNT